MANTDRPNGGRGVRSTHQTQPHQGNAYNVDSLNSTTIFVGDAMIHEADGNVAPYTGAGGGDLLGFCTGVDNDFDDLTRRHLPASTQGTVFIDDDPDTTFRIQEDDDGTPLTSADIGSLVDVLSTLGSTDTSISAHEIDRSTILQASGQLRLLRLIPIEDNDFGDFASWEVQINEHERRASKAGV